ncbi:transposase [Streptomyces sp. NPDC049949]|uniref:RNA-guided endonuclease InsQ/TnpB family protein n=1 Tax=Streptomyces sp. NPDC049949 TaxID=3154627 RepID=UPI00343ED350
MIGAGHVRYTYRLRVSSTGLSRLGAEWARCRWVWNECVAVSRKLNGLNRPDGQKAACGPAELDKMLTQARQSMALAGGLVLTVVWSRDLPSAPTSVRVYRDSLGHWYASFVVEAATEPLPATGAVIGIDRGVRETATTTSDEHDLPHAEHGRTAASKLARYHRMTARRRTPKYKPDSAGYKRAGRAAAKVSKKIVRQRQDTARKWAKSIVRDFDHVAVEDFRPRFLAQSTMARKAADAAIAAAKTALIEMARKHGRAVHLVHPAHTAMDCAQCGARAKHRIPLSERTYTCTACGTVSPRDKNSARVMLVRAGLNPAGADLVSPGVC